MRSTDTSVRVTALQARDFTAWRAAYGDYGAAVDSPVDDAIAAQVWSWLMTSAYGLSGIGAFDGTELVGFAHYRAFPRTLDGNEAGFLDDLWVEPSHRGSSVVRVLFEHVTFIANERNWTHVRWVANGQNTRARRLYERIARRVDVFTYRLDTSDRR